MKIVFWEHDVELQNKHLIPRKMSTQQTARNTKKEQMRQTKRLTTNTKLPWHV